MTFSKIASGLFISGFLFTNLAFNLNTNNLNLIQTYAQPDTSETDAKIESISQELEKVSAEAQDITKKKDNVNDEINRISDTIARTEDLIKESEDLIASLDKEIKANEEEVEELTAETKKLLKEAQLASNQSPLEAFLGSQNIGDLLTRVYAYSSASSELQSKSDQLELLNLELSSNKEQQEKVKDESEITKSILVISRSEKETLFNEFLGKEEEYQESIARLREDRDALEAKAAEAEAAWQKQEAERKAAEARSQQADTQTGSRGSGSTGVSITPQPGRCFFEDARNPSVNFINPVPGATISDIFGCPTPYSGSWRSGHDGIDLAIAAGTPILSTGDGVVHNKGSFNIEGYGNWIMVKHTLASGERVYSLYAHMISPSPLSVGTSVSRGQQIGRVGSTGLSTGNHLHFMLYTQSFETNGMGCRWGSSKCFDPAKLISF